MNKKYLNPVLITGAGFSKHLYPNYPLEREILNNGIEILKSEDLNFYNTLKSNISKYFPSNNLDELSIEEILSKIDLELYIIQNRIDKSKTKKLRDIYYDLLHIRDSILLVYWKSIDLNVQFNNNQLIEFLSYIGFPLTIISYNQDFIIEYLCMQKKIPWNYGIPIITRSRANGSFYFEELNPTEEISDYSKLKLNERLPFYKNENSQLILLKLHGSFNWFYCPNCEKFRGRPFDKAGISGRPYSLTYQEQDWPLCTNLKCLEKFKAQPLYAPLILPPTYLKNYSKGFIPDLWLSATNYIENTKNLIVFGYSFREEDALSIHLLYNLKAKNPKLDQISVIDKAFEKSNSFSVHVEKITKLKCRPYKSLQDFLNSKK